MSMAWTCRPGLTSHSNDSIIANVHYVHQMDSELMTTYPITLVFADGATCTVEVGVGQNIVQAFADQGYALLTDCSEGRCGTCMGRVLAGDVELGEYDEQTLFDDDRSQGMILPCVATAAQTCVIELPYDFSEVTAENIQTPVTVAESVSVAEDVVRLTLDLDAPLHFLPGQYARLTPEGHSFTRSYSMANRPGDQRAIFYVRLVQNGAFSKWAVNEAKPGATVLMSRPCGSFFLRDENRPRLFVAGGTGLAPFLSMLHAMSHSAAQSHSTQILVGARTEKHLFCLPELSDFAAKIPRLRIHTLVENVESSGFTQGFATDAISEGTVDADARAYLCGPPPMVEAGRKALERIKIRSSDVLCERFT